MLSEIKGYLKRTLSKKADNFRYKREKKIATGGSVEDRLILASNPKTHREILYYMAQNDNDTDVKKALINNPSIPYQTMPILAKDEDRSIREFFTGKLVEDLDSLLDTEKKLKGFVMDAMDVLVRDNILEIRMALASALKDHANAPPRIVGQLARDLERRVAEPILRFCASMSEEDILEILKNNPKSWQTCAIAQREMVSLKISEAVIDTEDVKAGKLLLENEGAEFDDKLRQKTIEKSREIKEWQDAIARNMELTTVMAKTFAEFAEASVRDALMERNDINMEEINEVIKVFRRRVNYSRDKDKKTGLKPKERVKQYFKDGLLNEETLADAISMRDVDFVKEAIAFMAFTSVDKVEKILAMKIPKSIVSICWKAGMSMQLALKLQKEIAHILPSDVIYPSVKNDYPYKPAEMEKNLKFFDM